jgi:TIR domain
MLRDHESSSPFDLPEGFRSQTNKNVLKTTKDANENAFRIAEQRSRAEHRVRRPLHQVLSCPECAFQRFLYRATWAVDSPSESTYILANGNGTPTRQSLRCSWKGGAGVKQWDVFLSHASEDKETVAMPLAQALVRSGVRVWLDKFEIRLGDSIRAKIDEGLALSSFGVVILSEIFFHKLWTGRELDGLFAKDAILPVWHGIDSKLVRRYSPMLAGRLAASTADGLDAVASSIVERIYLPGADDAIPPGTARRLAVLLSNAGTAAEVATYLADDPSLVARLFQLHRQDFVRSAVRLGADDVDYVVAHYQPTPRRLGDWWFIFLGSPADAILQDSMPTAALTRLIRRADAVRNWIAFNPDAADQALPNVRATFRATLVIGRRPQPDSETARALGGLNDEAVGFNVRTFDWLLDETFRIETERPNADD